MKIIARGAESILYIKNGKLIKERIKKSYRIEEIDNKLRKYRTRKEAKLLNEAKRAGVKTPNVYDVDEKEMKIEMEFIKGDVLRDCLEKIENREEICREIGRQIALMHDQNIVHGDLTTSNIIIHNGELYFIDFGLGEHSKRIEDKAVDLHVLKEALESKHFSIAEECWKNILKGYSVSKNFNEVVERLKDIEKRGRYIRKI